MSIQEIETAIGQLPEPDVWKLADWINELKNRQWDEQIERDASEGRLDDLINEAKEEIRQGRTSPL